MRQRRRGGHRGDLGDRDEADEAADEDDHDRLEEIGQDQYRAALTLTVAAVSGSYVGTVAKSKCELGFAENAIRLLWSLTD